MAQSKNERCLGTRKGASPPADRISAAIQTLEAGVKKLVESGEWEAWLRFQAAFHSYSYSNVLLIRAQRPDARRVAGFRAWEKLGRTVMKGEKAIWILAPRLVKVGGDDPLAGEEDQGEESDARAPRKTRVGFRAVPAFDVSQTEGEDLPSPARRLTGEDDGGGLFKRLRGVSESRGCPVVLDDLHGQVNGLYSPHEHRIVVAEGLAPVQAAKTLAHEIAHSILHRDIEEYRANCEDAELEAESVAFVVLNRFGIDAGQYSFGYLAAWQGGDAGATRALKDCAGRIQKTACEIIDWIEAADLMDETAQKIQALAP